MAVSRSRLAVAFAISVFALFAAQSLAVGFATSSSYTATTEITNNNVSTHVPVMSLYTKSGNDYVIAGDDVFSKGTVSYSYNDSNKKYSITAVSNLEMTDGGLYLMISGCTGEFTLGGSVTTNTSNSNVTVSGYTLSVTKSGTSYVFYGQSATTVTISAGQYYKISLKCNVSAYSASTNIPKTPVSTVNINATYLSTAAFIDAGNQIALSGTYTAGMAVEDMGDLNNCDTSGQYPSFHGVGDDANETYYFLPGSSESGHSVVYISDGTDTSDPSISDASLLSGDDFHISILVPVNQSFVIKGKLSEPILSSGEYWVSLTVGGVTYTSDTITSGSTYYFYVSQNTPNKLDHVSNISNITNSMWMNFDEEITFVAQGETGGGILTTAKVTLGIIFK